jgi:hypothetical protein
MTNLKLSLLNPLAILALVLANSIYPGSLAGAELRFSPATVSLTSPEASQQLLISDLSTSANPLDVTRLASYEVRPQTLARVDERGLVHPLMEGQGEIVVQQNGEELHIPMTVTGFQLPPPVSYRNDITAILTKARCNSGGCHGKAEGQNGFKLSIFGYDTLADHTALVQESRGRRVTVARPTSSLVYLKGSARIPHGGGRKIEPGGYRDRLLLRWITEGAQYDSEAEGQARQIVGIQIEPEQQVLVAGGTQQLQVTAIDAAGNRRCVTADTDFESNAASIADVDDRGLIEASNIPGEAAILVRYLGHVSVCRITLPRPGVTFTRPAENNFIDKLVWDKLERLGIEPSGPSDDAAFLRRVYLDTIGTLPTVAEARAFLADNSTDKREKLVDHLLARPEYADYWTMKWLDILRADQLKISSQGAVAMQRWLRKQFAENRPFDEFARALLTVQGNTSAEGLGSFYKILNKPEEAAESISQLLLGVRIECAHCHHHPSERWSQTDYVALTNFFTGVTLKKLPNGEQAIVARGGTDLPHPRTQEIVPAAALGAEVADFTGIADRRQVLADWMTKPENPFFAKAISNRLWAHYFGRGLVEPIDDMRETNPASNEPLMRALTDRMREVRFDLKAFTRTLLLSRAYQLSAETNASNESDVQNFSHALYKSLPAEVLLDAISQSTGVPEKFNGWPAGYRSIQLWEARLPNYFFTIFGRPARTTVCECERSNAPSISQALHLLNAPEIAEKIDHRHGRARALAQAEMTPEQIVEELYLATLSRLPTPEEQSLMMQAFGDSTEAGAEDVLWALLNTKEFVFNH